MPSNKPASSSKAISDLVEKGVLAPIEIVAANTQITTFEQNVYTAQELVTQAENILKTLMLPDTSDAIWKRALVPVSSVEVEIPRVSLESAIADALVNRQELAQLKSNYDINKINERYFRDLTKPQIDLVGSYTANGLAGTSVPRIGNATTSALTTRVNDLSVLQRTAAAAGFDRYLDRAANLVGGYFKSLSNLATADYPTFRVGVTISLPFRNRTAQANLGRTLVEADQIKNQQAQQEQTIESDVRNALQALRSSEARLQVGDRYAPVRRTALRKRTATVSRRNFDCFSRSAASDHARVVTQQRTASPDSAQQSRFDVSAFDRHDAFRQQRRNYRQNQRRKIQIPSPD